MIPFTPPPCWKEVPFVRLVIPFVLGIVIQWYGQAPAIAGWGILGVSLIGLFVFSWLRLSWQFRWQWFNGLWLHTFLVAAGMVLTYHKDIRHHPQWFSKFYSEGNTIVVTIEEPPSEKKQSHKALASVQAVIRSNGSMKITKGNILIYFAKDHSSPAVQYGDQLIFFKSLQPVPNSGNPGSFDYQAYCAFRNTYHQVYLKQEEYVGLKVKNENVLKKFLFATREQVVAILKKYIPGKKEAGLAEAMLIGYKDDLDKDLLQSYSNTGVTHIIAISGLHLGLIYWLLTWLVKPLEKRRIARIAKPVIIISGLWLFSLAAGASPSVLRAAVMFSCIVLGSSLSRRSSVYNSLASSAFILLCIDPCWLWDAGFQLSYAAVLSIVLFMKPMYDRLYIKNKLLDQVWKLTAVTLAAQILTVPLTLYHFHQFPNLFVITNLVAVPVSTIILGGELLLCALCWFPMAAGATGWTLGKLIGVLNDFIEVAAQVPFAIWDHLQISTAQVFLLYVFIAGVAWWLFQGRKGMLFTALTALLLFAMLRTISFFEASKQQKLIVYNVPQHQAMDFISGRNYYFICDAALVADAATQRFHLKPSRILHRITRRNALPNLVVAGNLFHFGPTSVLLIDSAMRLQKPANKIKVDVIILARNARVQISQLIQVFQFRQLVINANNFRSRTRRWKADCNALNIPCHVVAEQGAFVLSLR